MSKIAEAEKIDLSYLNRLLRLTLLTPDIQESVLHGRQPKAMQIEELTRPMPMALDEQRKSFVFKA